MRDFFAAVQALAKELMRARRVRYAPEPCSQRAALRNNLRASGCSGKRDSHRHMAGPDQTAAAHMEDAGANDPEIFPQRQRQGPHRRSRSRTCRCSMRCATISASTIRISAAGSRNAAPAPCISTASRSAPASRRSSDVGDAKIVTLAGLGTPDNPHPLQTAYVEEQVPQCAYCINGWIMTAAAFLRDKQEADRRRNPRGADRAEMPLRHPYGDPARRQARRRDDGLREAAMTRHRKIRNLLAPRLAQGRWRARGLDRRAGRFRSRARGRRRDGRRQSSRR